jgi:hypothetical protein
LEVGTAKEAIDEVLMVRAGLVGRGFAKDAWMDAWKDAAWKEAWKAE